METGSAEEQRLMDTMGHDVGQLIRKYLDDNEPDLEVLQSRSSCLLTVLELTCNVLRTLNTHVSQRLQDRNARP